MHTNRLLTIGLMVVGCSALSQASIVYSIGSAPGDTFTNASTTNQGLAVGDSGWYYNNVRNQGVVGINTTFARSGNGSAYLETVLGPGGASSKADIEILAKGVNVGGNYAASGYFGTLGSLTSLSYDWYRSSLSTNSAVQHPALRILLDADGDLTTTGDRGGLVFERTYNSLPTTTDTWMTDAVSSSTKLWSYGLGRSFEFGGYRTMDEWLDGFTVGAQSSTLSADSKIIGFSAGVGSGWGPFKGAVDNISFGFGDRQATSYNFEVGAVPGPAAALPMALGLLIGLRRRAKK